MKKGLFIILICVLLASAFVYWQHLKSSKKELESEKSNKTSSVTEEKKETSSPPPPTIIDGKWVLQWHETFDTFDKRKWNIEKRGNNYNKEQQYYRKENVTIQDGSLLLTGKREDYKKHKFTSGKITTQNKFEMKYGRIEIVARTNGGNGSFPAIWMLPSEEKSLPEIDIFEAVGIEKNIVYYVNHWEENKKNKRSFKLLQIDNLDEFHTYAIEWNKDEIKWFVDGVHQYTSTEGIPNEPMYLIINLAIGGGGWIGAPDENTEFPLLFEIQDLKVMTELQ
ncbi:family 16 glycosylhydrolase [Bacillus sp. 1P06AnD]|uniref:glycoside hydrolase family 16 protein n=1 Tax=Bacillus sp. 1P06AnD TaxID=3132208 RepID=UPI0039A1312D